MSDGDLVSIRLPELSTALHAALSHAGCDEQNAVMVTSVIVAAERDGCASHGIFRLPGYLAALNSGKVDGCARPTATKTGPAVVQVDGHGGFAPLAMSVARQELAPIATEQGIAAAAVVNVHHFSALWIDIEPLVESGLVAMCFTSYLPTVAPAGSVHPLYGTNPMAFGFPRPDGGTLIFDQASAAMARGEIQLAAREGEPVPAGVGLDRDGRPTTDPAEILLGAQLPFGGYKGASIALMIELLAGGLIGQPFSHEAAEQDNSDGGPPRGGVLMLALAPSRFGDASGWQRHSEQFLKRLVGLGDTRLPGARRASNRRRIDREGVTLPVQIWRDVLAASATRH